MSSAGASIFWRSNLRRPGQQVYSKKRRQIRLGSIPRDDRLALRSGGLLDKSHKIRRYTRKDYPAVVEFPVESIGRDGIVRRYSFEESIRLYQRRIASADLRYSDADLIQAEKQHCLSRIQQLRRSFFAHYGCPRSGRLMPSRMHPAFSQRRWQRFCGGVFLPSTRSQSGSA